MPVAEFDGEVVVDSMAIVDRLEEVVARPVAVPDGARLTGAAAEAFVAWFNVVWKVSPNELADLSTPAGPGHGDVTRSSRRCCATRLGVFEHRLRGGDFLFGHGLTVADVCAFPFVKYALLHDPDDTETFHRVLMEHQVLGDDHPRVRAWIARMDALPRA